MNRYFKLVIATALIGVTTSANAIDRKTLAQVRFFVTRTEERAVKGSFTQADGQEESTKVWW